MRVVFMGTPSFAVPSFDAVLGRHEVVAAYTRPDSASGRGRRIGAPAVKQRAQTVGVPVEQPPTLRDVAVQERLAALSPDVIVVAAYGLILPPEVLEVPPCGCINVHASLLPRWRGAAPIQRAILAGDDVTGVSIMRMDAGLDTGPWCLQVQVRADDRDADELTSELARLGAEALLLALDGIQSNDVVWTEQDDALATYADKLTARDVALEPALTVTDALRRVRASGSSAPARLMLGGRRLTVAAASASPADLLPGEARCTRELEIGLADGAVRLDSVIPEGRALMSGDAFARGAHLPGDCSWSAS